MIPSIAIIGAGITGLTAPKFWLISRRDERRTHFALHRSGCAHSNGQGAWLADGAHCARNVSGIDLCRCEGIGAQGGAVAGHHGIGIYAAPQKRMTHACSKREIRRSLYPSFRSFPLSTRPPFFSMSCFSARNRLFVAWSSNSASFLVCRLVVAFTSSTCPTVPHYSIANSELFSCGL